MSRDTWACLACGHDVWETHSLNLKECRACPGGLCQRGGEGMTARQGSANPWACVCGYDGTSARDLDEHIVAARDDDDHAPAN